MIYRVERQRIVTEVFLIEADSKDKAAEAVPYMEEYMANAIVDECEEPDIEDNTEEIEDVYDRVWKLEDEYVVPISTCSKVLYDYRH